MKMKKLSALFLCVAVAASAMAGCTSERDTVSSAPASSAGTESAPAGEVSSAAEAGEGASSAVVVGAGLPDTLENPNISIVYWYGKNAYKQDQAANPNIYDCIWEAIAPFEEKYGGKVTVIETDWGSMAQKVAELQSAGSAPELMEVYDRVFHNLALTGKLTDLSSYVSEEDYAFYQPELKELMSWKGVPYAIPIKPYWPYIAFNRDMIDMEGLTQPDELFKQGKWTFDEFAKIVKACTKYKDGVGVQYGFGSWNGDGTSRFLISNGTAFMNVDQAAGKVTSGFKDQKLLDTLDWMRGWAANPTTGWIQGNDAMYDGFDGGTLAMIDGIGYIKEGDYTFNTGYVPYPKGPDYTDGIPVATMPQGFGVPTGAKNVEGAVAFMRMVNQMQVTVGNEREIATIGEDTFNMVYNNPDVKLVYAYDKSTANVDQIIGSTINLVVDNTPAATIAESVDPQMQADIDLIFGS